jgi:hypothetical protein
LGINTITSDDTEVRMYIGIGTLLIIIILIIVLL